MKCAMCSGKTHSQQVEHKELGILLGKFKAEVCEKCGETYFDGETAEKIQKKSKELGLFGLARKNYCGRSRQQLGYPHPEGDCHIP